MGNSQTSSFHQSLTDFTIIDQQLEKNLTRLKRKDNSKEYLLKQTIYSDEKMYQNALKQYDVRKTYKSDHLTLLEKHETTKTDNLCSTLYKIYALWVHPIRSLRSEIFERIQQNRTFNEKQLWSIAASCILALSELQKNDVFHEHLSTSEIYLTEDGIVNIADPLTIQSPSNFNLIKEKKTHHQNIYLSPEQCSAIQSHAFCFRHFKNDVWCLGMVLLECALLEMQTSCYRAEYQKINWLELDKSIQKLEGRYGRELKSMVKLMLNKNKKDRPDWEELETFVRRDDEPKVPSPIKHSFLKTSNFGFKDEHRFSDNQTIPLHFAHHSKHSPCAPKMPLSNVPAVSIQTQVTYTSHPQPIQNTFQKSFNKVIDAPTYSSLNSNFQSPSCQSSMKPAHENVFCKPTLPTRPELTFFKSSFNTNNIEFKSPIDSQFDQKNSELRHHAQYRSYSKPANLKEQAQEMESHFIKTKVTNDLANSAGFCSVHQRENTEPKDKAQELGERQTLKTFFSPSSAQGYLFTQRNECQQKKKEKEVDLLPCNQQFLRGNSEEPQQEKSAIQFENFAQEVKNTESITYQIQHRPFFLHQNQNIMPEILKNYEMQEKKVQKQIHFEKIEAIENNQNIPKSNFLQKNYQKVGKSSILPAPKKFDEEEGQYVIENFKQGSRYEGFKKNGKRHGHGKFFYQDGGMYEGNWNQNKMEGYGTLYYESGKAAYEGEWKDDQFHGKGKLYNQNPQPLQNPFDYCNFDHVDDYWTLYEGEFFQDMKQGRGKFTLSNGEHYLGEFSTDYINGSGKFYRKNANIFRGTWKENHLVSSHS